jgi:hypothetical protein
MQISIFWCFTILTFNCEPECWKFQNFKPNNFIMSELPYFLCGTLFQTILQKISLQANMFRLFPASDLTITASYVDFVHSDFSFQRSIKSLFFLFMSK